MDKLSETRIDALFFIYIFLLNNHKVEPPNVSVYPFYPSWDIGSFGEAGIT